MAVGLIQRINACLQDIVILHLVQVGTMQGGSQLWKMHLAKDISIYMALIAGKRPNNQRFFLFATIRLKNPSFCDLLIIDNPLYYYILCFGVKGLFQFGV